MASRPRALGDGVGEPGLAPHRGGGPRPDLATLEHAAFTAWPAEEVEACGPWRLRHTRGLTRRGNSAWPVPGPAADRPPAPVILERAEAFYRDRGLTPLLQVGPGGPALEAALDERGYTPEAGVSILCAVAGALAARPAAAGVVTRVAGVEPGAIDERWFAHAGRRGRFANHADVFRGIVERQGPRAGLAAAEIDGGTVATALAALGGPWAGLFHVRTSPGQRRRGVARALVGAVARWARDRGAAGLYLQVERDNAAALACFAGLGFAEAYRYRYLRGPLRPTPGGLSPGSG